MSNIESIIQQKYKQSPQLDFMWRVELPILSQYSDPTGAVSAYAKRFLPSLSKPTDPKVVSSVGASEVSNRVYEISTSYHSFGVDKSIYATTTTNSAGTRDIGSITITIDEFEDGLTFKYINTWMSLISNTDLSRNPPVYYKRPIKFIRMDSQHADIGSSMYIGCWPSDINQISNNYEGNGVSQYNVTFQVDDVVHS